MRRSKVKAHRGCMIALRTSKCNRDQRIFFRLSPALCMSYAYTRSQNLAVRITDLCLGEEEFLEQLCGVFGTSNSMSDSPLVLVDLVIVSSHVGLQVNLNINHGSLD